MNIRLVYLEIPGMAMRTEKRWMILTADRSRVMGKMNLERCQVMPVVWMNPAAPLKIMVVLIVQISFRISRRER